MIPRSRVATVEDVDTLGHLRALMADGHSRYPVLSAGTQDVVGVVHLHDLLATDAPDAAPIASLARPPMVLSNLTSLPEALRRLDQTRNQLACVIDEYGGFCGVITHEDLAEELVGEITDEHDDEAHPGYVPIEGDGVWEMAGDVHVDELERALQADLPRGSYQTVAGLIIAAYGSLPEAGASLRIELPPDPAELAHDDDPSPRYLDATVLTVEQHVPARLRLELTGGRAPDTDAEPDTRSDS